MKIARECIPCLARQAVEIAQEATTNGSLQEQIIKASLAELANMSFEQTAPEVAYKMHKHAKVLTGVDDPYRALKATYNNVALEIAQRLRENRCVEDSNSPFDTSCRLAIAGNIIDFAVGLSLGYEDILRSVDDSLKKPLYGVGSEALRAAAAKANSILYLADNAGEIVFDRFLIELLPAGKVKLVVKGGPIVNDATLEDAVAAGLTDIIEVIDNGHDAQGTLLAACSDEFRHAFDQADLIISKGQANYETLSGVKDKQIFFLLRAKCPAVANSIGCDRMAYVLTTMPH